MLIKGKIGGIMDIRLITNGIIIKERLIPVEDIDWCQTTKANKLELILKSKETVSVDYTDDEKEQARKIKKDIRKAVNILEHEKERAEAQIYCEIFEDMTAFGKPVIKGKWSYEGMLIGSKMIPVEEIKDCKFVASGYAYCILFELKNGKYERFDLVNEEQYEQGRRAVMMIIKQLRLMESEDWSK